MEVFRHVVFRSRKNCEPWSLSILPVNFSICARRSGSGGTMSFHLLACLWHCREWFVWYRRVSLTGGRHTALVMFALCHFGPAFDYGSCVAYLLSGIHVPLMTRSIQTPREVVGGFGSDACDVLAVHSNGLRSHTCLVFPWMRCMRRTWADQFVPLSPFDLSVPLNDTLPWCRSCLTIRGGNTGTWNKVVDGCYLVDPASSHMLVSKIKPCMCKVRFRRGSLRNGYHIQGRQQARKLPNPDTGRRTTAKAFAKDVFINQERKLGARRRSDTVLVSTINDADQGSADVAFRTPLAPYEKSKSLGSGGVWSQG
ncbi:hypothetical protein Lal_00049257 [Lupinus albus]|nr:hypothetical protein Lal_00049257 [Lupinus albus]